MPSDLAERSSSSTTACIACPVKLTDAVQEALDEIANASLVILGYGLCGNGLRGIRAGPHTLLIPRTDDCIAILLGSYKAYMREFSTVPGTYYLTKGWLESGSHPLKEYHEYVPKYGAEEDDVAPDQQYQHYERVALVASTPEEMDAYREQAQEVARFCERWGMALRGNPRLGRLRAAAVRDGRGRARRRLERPHVGSDFWSIPPGGEIRQDMFMR